MIDFMTIAVNGDRHLSPTDKMVYVRLTVELDTVQFKPMKARALGHMVNVKPQTAARALRALTAAGFLDVITPPNPSDPRLYRRPLTRLHFEASKAA